LRIIMREWPILGPDSELAARASLAAIKQNKFEAFHEALMAHPRANTVFIRRAAEQAGLDYDQLQAWTRLKAMPISQSLTISHGSLEYPARRRF